MDIITLSIKQKYFNEIISGTKKKEYREVAPTTCRKYLIIDSDGYCKQKKNGDIVPRKYDAIRFYTGKMQNKRPTALIEIVNTICEMLFDETGKPVTSKINNFVCCNHRSFILLFV